jgi:Ca2+-binding EF-hand superfamily protein
MGSLYRHLAAACVLGMLVAVDAEGQTAPAPTARGLVQQYDRNRDDKLDREEFHQAVVETFFFRDRDRDGYLTIIELETAAPEAVKAASRKGDSRLTLPEYINAIFKDYLAADTDEDGMLTAAEIEVYMSPRRP